MTYPDKVCASRFDVEIQEIEDYAVRKVTKASIVDNQSFAGVDHLYLVSNCNTTKAIARTLI
jgi:hypothetical protein